MATFSIALGASISTAVAAGAAGDTFVLAAGTYRGQFWTTKSGCIYVGDPSGTTVISGSGLLGSWTNTSGNLWKSISITTDSGTAAVPASNNSGVFTASISGTTMTVTAIASGFVSTSPHTLYDAVGGIVAGTYVTGQITGAANSTGTYSLSVTQGTVTSRTMYQTASLGQIYPSVNPMANFAEDLWFNGARLIRVAAPGPATAGKWWFDPTDNSVNIFNVGTPTGTWEFPTIHNFMNSNLPMSCFNITFEKCASPAQAGCFHQVSNLTLVSCSISNNGGGGIDVNGGGCILQNCKVQNNGHTGITGTTLNDGFATQIIDCEVSGNNQHQYQIGWDAAGIKFGASCNVLISGCNIHDNQGMGIWGDVDSAEFVIKNNKVTNCTGISTDTSCGIMFEISHGALIKDNVVSGCTASAIFISNSNGVEVSGNLVTVKAGNSGTNAGGIVAWNNSGRGNGSGGIAYETRNLNVHDNTVVHTTDTAPDGYFCFQSITSPNVVWNNNVYIVQNTTTSYWEFDSFTSVVHAYTWSGLQASGNGFETTGQSLVGTASTYTSVMALLADGQGAGAITPADVRLILLALLITQRNVP